MAFDYGSLSIMSGIAGAASSTIGAFYSAQSQRSSARFQADMDEIGARIAEIGAQAELLQGQGLIGQLTAKAGRIKASQRTAQAANGLALGFGSAAEVRASTDLSKEIDVNAIEANAVRSAWGYRGQAANLRANANMRRASANSISPVGAAAGTLLTGASRVADTWYRLDNAGALDTFKANMTADPIGSMGSARGWWST
jgi:hypothetical protein